MKWEHIEKKIFEIKHSKNKIEANLIKHMLRVFQKYIFTTIVSVH